MTFYYASKSSNFQMQFLSRWSIDFFDTEFKNLLEYYPPPNLTCLNPFRLFLKIKDLNPTNDTEDYQEIPKYISFYHLNTPKDVGTKEFLEHCVCHILQSPYIKSIDEETNLTQLHIKSKLKSSIVFETSTITVSFSFISKDDKSLYFEYGEVIGLVIEGNAYLITVVSHLKSEVQEYTETILLPHLVSTTQTKFNYNLINYSESNVTDIQEKLSYYGEFRFFDPNAAVSLAFPAYPLEFRPDYSPIQSAGVGSLLCLTLKLNMHEILTAEAGLEAITSRAYKVAPVTMFLELEDLHKCGYGTILSISDYFDQKIARIIQSFPGSITVGSRVSNNISYRPGQSIMMLLACDINGALSSTDRVKSLIVSSIIGNYGVTTVYLTATTQGIFDNYLFLFNTFIKQITFIDEIDLKRKFTKEDSDTIICLENISDLKQVYPEAETEIIAKHNLSLLKSGERIPPFTQIIKVKGSECSAKYLYMDTKYKEPVDIDFPTQIECSCSTELSEVISIEEVKHLQHVIDWSMKYNYCNVSTTQFGESKENVSEIELSGKNMNVATSIDFNQSFKKVKSNCSERVESTNGSLANEYVSDPEIQLETDTIDTTLSTISNCDSQLIVNDVTNRSIEHSVEIKVNDIENRKSVHDTDLECIDSNSGHNTNDTELSLKEINLLEVYVHCCEMCQCKPNSSILKYLPDHPEYFFNVKEINLGSNYLGHTGFKAVVSFLSYLPNLAILQLSDMCLDNTDISILCLSLKFHKIRTLNLSNNPAITLPSVKPLLSLLKSNKNIKNVILSGSGIADTLIQKIESTANGSSY